MFYVVRRRSIVMCAFLVIFVAFASLCLIGGNVMAEATYAKERKVPVYNVDTNEKIVALTFDAAWGADKTEGIMNILDEYGAKGTFFLVGFWIDKYPDMVKQIAERGFAIGNHSNNHLKMSTLSDDVIIDEIDYVNKEIERLTGKKPIFFRAPFGDYNNALMNNISAQNMIGIQWDVDSLDWKGISGKNICDRVMAKAGNGSIILFHNNSDHVLDALPLVLLGLKNKGYKFVTLDEMVMTEDFYIDNAGKQHKMQNYMN